VALSAETITNLEIAKIAIQEYLDNRVDEIDDLVFNLKAYGVPLDSLSVSTTEAATDEAMATISSLLAF